MDHSSHTEEEHDADAMAADLAGFGEAQVLEKPVVAAARGAMGDAAAFDARVRLLWFGAGTGEPREWGITQRRLAELDQAGIRYTCRETPDVAHEWLTCAV